MAEDNKGYYCSKVKFYFLDINSNGEVNTSHIPLNTAGNTQGLASLYPGDGSNHYFNDIEIYLKETDLADTYEIDKSYTDTTRPGKFCLKAFSDNSQNNFNTPILNKYIDSSSGTEQLYSANGFIMPTKVVVDGMFEKNISSYNLFYRQDFGTSGNSIWKDIDISKIKNKFDYVKYQLPFDLGASLRMIKPVDSSINKDWNGFAMSPWYEHLGITEEELNAYYKPEDSDSRFKYVPRIQFRLVCLEKFTNLWRLADPQRLDYYPVTDTDLATCTNTEKFGTKALTAKIVPPGSLYYANNVVMSTKDLLPGGTDFSLNNVSGSKVPAYSIIWLTGREIKYLQFKDAEHTYADTWKKFKIYNPNPFSVYCYVCNRRLKALDPNVWMLDPEDKKENGFRYFGEIKANETTAEIEVGDWPFYEDFGVAVYFLVNYGDCCKMYATMMSNTDTIESAMTYRYKYFKLGE